MTKRTFMVSIPDNFVEFTEDELNMIERLIDLKRKYSTEQELNIISSIDDKIIDAKLYYDRIERAKSGLY